VRLFLRLNAVVSGLVLIGAILFGRDVIRIWMGDSFNAEDASLVFIVLLAAKLLVFTTNPFTNVLFAMAKHRYQAYVSGVEAITSLALIPLFMHFMDNPLLAASLAIGLPFTVTRTFVVPFIVQQNTQLTIAFLYKTLLPLTIPVVIFGYLCQLTLTALAPAEPTLLELLAGIALVGLGYSALVFLVLLTGEERELLRKGLGIPRNNHA